jgi:hypothetical protein
MTYYGAKLRDTVKFCPSADKTGEMLQHAAVRKLKLYAARCDFWQIS